MNEQRQAAEALATVQAHQNKARQAARVPWWTYVAMFVLCAGAVASTDFLTLSGAKFTAIVILVLLVLTLVLTFASRSAPLDRVRGVAPRRPFVPRIYGPMLLVDGVAIWLITRYGTGFAQRIADPIGLSHYPNTVAGVLFGAVFTGLFALYHLLIAASQRRTNP